MDTTLPARHNKVPSGFWERLADSLRRLKPVTNGVLRLRERLLVTVSMRQATGQFRDIYDEDAVFLAPVQDDLVLVHSNAVEWVDIGCPGRT